MSGCTPPPIPYLKAALNKWIPDICKYHDDAWSTRKWRDKCLADVKATLDLLLRGIVLTLCGMGAPIWFVVFGTPYWLWKKYKGKIGAGFTILCKWFKG